jgi:hypothetical protein
MRRELYAATASPEYMELVRCRRIDHRVRGYRPPQSALSLGIHEQHLAHFNFEWLASSVSSLGFDNPRLEGGVVKIPVHIDDYELFRGRSYDDWERTVLELAGNRRLTVVSLHDCYARYWIDRYGELLRRLGELGAFRTLDEVADDVLRSSTRWI